jgi:GDP-L-fucose synthase
VTTRVPAQTVMDVVSCRAQTAHDSSKPEPDSTPRKLLDGSRSAAFVWRVRTPLLEGIARAYTSAPFHH